MSATLRLSDFTENARLFPTPPPTEKVFLNFSQNFVRLAVDRNKFMEYSQLKFFRKAKEYG